MHHDSHFYTGDVPFSVSVCTCRVWLTSTWCWCVFLSIGRSCQARGRKCWTQKRGAEIETTPHTRRNSQWRSVAIATSFFSLLHYLLLAVQQFPVPKDVISTKNEQQVPPTSETTPTNTPVPTCTPTKAKTNKEEKKRSGGGGGGNTPTPVDVSRLDMRVGRILKAWKHPDADGLYVEEGEGIRVWYNVRCACLKLILNFSVCICYSARS